MDLSEEREDDCRPSKTTMTLGDCSQAEAKSSGTSCLSMRSDHSKDRLLNFSDSTEQRFHQEQSDAASGPHETNLLSTFMHLEENIFTFVKAELKMLQGVLISDHPEYLVEQDGEEEGMRSNRQALLKITLHFLKKMKQDELASSLQSRTMAAVCQKKLKCNLRRRFQCFVEGIATTGKTTLLNEIYTELHITEGGSREVNDIEIVSRKTSRSETVIRCEDIFKPLPGRAQPIRTVMTNGEAGMGKTVLTHKFSLDWAEDKANHNIQFMFPFTFRELNLLAGKEYSLIGLIHLFFAETKEAEICSFDRLSVIFMLDGLDESRFPLDFHNNEVLTDVTAVASVDTLLTNLISGNLLPSAHLWITTRPAAANQIPAECVDRMTEVRGFTDAQKKEFFRRRFQEEEQANRIISHVKASRSLHIMCQIPVFCWVTASVLDHVLRADENAELPKTLTEMYIHFLVVQCKVANVKYHGAAGSDLLWNAASSNIIMSLGRLAFEHLQKGNLVFYESDLRECDIDIRAASLYSGLFTQIFKEECGLYHDKVFCFVHLSVQEFLAALYVFVTFISTGVNLLSVSESTSKSMWSRLRRESLKVNPFHQSAVEKTIQSPNGHLDFFLRFLLGFSSETNQELLHRVFNISRKNLQNYQETAKYIKKKIRRNLSPERCINLFHCLNELNDHSLVEEIQQCLSSGSLSTDNLSSAQWSALVFILLSSEKELEVFDLQKYSASEQGLLRLLPVVKASKISHLRNCKLSEKSCEALASVLESKSSCLRELDLTDNDLSDSGIKLLLTGLESVSCRLQSLQLNGCNLSKRSCVALASALSSSSLKVLDLSNNDLQDSGVKLLYAGVGSSQCGLETLRLSGCNLSARGCETLASILGSQSSSLRELDLNNNNLKDSGVKLISAGLASPNCRLEILRLSSCQVTEEGCAALASALTSNPSHLKELDLSYNHPGEAGVKLLSARQEDPCFRLEALCVDHGGRHRLEPFIYTCKVTLDSNTANRKLSVDHHLRKVTEELKEQRHPEHPDRFQHWKQVLCREALSGRCYWEVQWKGCVHVGMTYRGIKRKGDSDESCLSENHKSWGLFCSARGFSACHDKRTKDLRAVPSSVGSSRVGVYLNWPAGTLSFYSVSSEAVIHLHTFHCRFTEPLYPAFRFWSRSESGSAVSLCWVEEGETEGDPHAS